MRKELQKIARDTAAVGLSAAAAGLEIGSEFARKTLDEVSREDPAPPTPPVSAAPAPPAAGPADESITIRAYHLWEKAGCPEGRDQEFYFQAEREQRDREKPGRTRASDLIACAALLRLAAPCYYFHMAKDPGAVALGKKRAQNLRNKLGSDEALKDHMRRVRAGEKLSSPLSPARQLTTARHGMMELSSTGLFRFALSF